MRTRAAVKSASPSVRFVGSAFPLRGQVIMRCGIVSSWRLATLLALAVAVRPRAACAPRDAITARDCRGSERPVPLTYLVHRSSMAV